MAVYAETLAHAYRFAGAPRPVKPRKGTVERARKERQGWYRHLVAYAVGCAVMIGLGLPSGRGYDALLGPAGGWTIVLVVDGLVSFGYGGDRDKGGDTDADRDKSASLSA